MITPLHGCGDPGTDRLGGKGAALARLTAAGLPVPAGLVVEVAAFREQIRRATEAG